MITGDRRDFLRALAGAAVAGVGFGLARRASAAEEGKVQRRVLGRTGAEVSILGLGLGSAFIGPHKADPDAAYAILQRAIEAHGINYWDTAASYSAKLDDGTTRYSEEVISAAVQAYRDQIFLVSKTGARDYDGYRRQLEQSLKRLGTDHLDCYHLHNFDPRRDTDLAAIENGAVRAAREAVEQGLIRHFGVTGHSGAQILIDAIQRFDPDLVLTTFPSTRPDNGRYETELLPLAVERRMGVVAMKTIRQAQGSSLQGTDLIRYAMSLDGVCTTIVGLDTTENLDRNAAMATDFQPLSAAQREALARRTRLALGDAPPPWLQPGYRDGVV